VVPYNLFLHAALVKDSKKQGVSLRQLQQDTYLSIAIGGLISICIVIAAASLSGQAISNARDMGLALEPVLGSYAKYLISLGLFAAGLSSAITAPLAAACVLGESLSWKNDKGSRSFKLTAIGVLVVGFIFASIGYKPVEIIQFAQVANGLLLPVIGVFIFWIVNAPNDLNISKPSLLENVLLLILMLFLFFLGMKSLGFIN
jgi:manganese transport protein